MAQKSFEPTEAQKTSLETTVQRRYSEELKRWPMGTSPNYSYEKDKGGTKTAAVTFYVGGKSFSADFKLQDNDSWYCQRDWRD